MIHRPHSADGNIRRDERVRDRRRHRLRRRLCWRLAGSSIRYPHFLTAHDETRIVRQSTGFHGRLIFNLANGWRSLDRSRLRVHTALWPPAVLRQQSATPIARNRRPTRRRLRRGVPQGIPLATYDPATRTLSVPVVGPSTGGLRPSGMPLLRTAAEWTGADSLPGVPPDVGSGPLDRSGPAGAISASSQRHSGAINGRSIPRISRNTKRVLRYLDSRFRLRYDALLDERRAYWIRTDSSIDCL